MTKTKTVSIPVAIAIADDNLAMPATPSVTALTTVQTETHEASPDHENMFSKRAAERAKIVAAKAECSGIARQSLAEANDFYNQGAGSTLVANQAASVAAKRLIQGQTDGLFDKNEVNAILGDIFGYKPKADGTPGKTPDGYGEAIRKRIVRLVSAIDHVETVSKSDYSDDTFQSAEKFFCGVPADELEEIVLGRGRPCSTPHFRSRANTRRSQRSDRRARSSDWVARREVRRVRRARAFQRDTSGCRTR